MYLILLCMRSIFTLAHIDTTALLLFFFFIHSRAIKFWKSKNGSEVTYGNLLWACCARGTHKAAKKICDMLNAKAEGLWD